MHTVDLNLAYIWCFGWTMQAVQLINQTDGIQRARDLAKHHCLMAAKMVGVILFDRR